MRKICLVLMLIGISTSLFAQQKLTLEESISIALQSNSSLIKTQNNLETNKSQLKNAYGELLPSLGAQAGWSWSRNEGQATIPDQFGVPTTVSTSSESRNYTAGVGGGITLFDGLSNIANISQKENSLESAKLSLSKLKQDIVYQTTDYYYTVLNSEALLKVREENVTYNEKFLETVQERNKLGAVPLADVYSQQVQLGNAELLQIQAQNDYETAKNSLLNYLSMDVLKEYSFVDPYAQLDTIDTDFYMKDFDNIQTMVNEALQNRDDYKSQQLTLEAAQSGVTMARSGYLPSLTGNYSFGTSAGTVNELFNRRTWSLSATLSIPIFSNFSTENSVQIAKTQELNAEEDLSALQRQIKIQIKQGYLDLTAAKKSLDVATKNVRAAGEDRRIKQERYNLGSGTILEVLQSDRDYTDAQRNRIDQLYNFYRLKDRLANYLGKLDYKKFE